MPPISLAARFGLLTMLIPLASVGAPVQAPPVDIPFVANAGELDPHVALYASTLSGPLYVTRNGELTYVLAGDGPSGASGRTAWVLKQRLRGAQPIRVQPMEPAPLTVRHLSSGAAAASAAPAQSTYRWADLGEVWTGVKARIHVQGGKAEQIFELAAGTDARQIHIELDGARRLVRDMHGDLIIETGASRAVLTAPIAWQEDADHERHPVAVRFMVRGKHNYGFAVGPHDPRYAITIDPLLQATYLGGAGFADQINGIATNSATGDVYVTGQTASTSGFPISAGALQPAPAGHTDAFIARLPANLRTFTEVTYLGGTGLDIGQSIAINLNSGDVYVAGISDSPDFPGLAGGAVSAAQAGYADSENAFIARLDASLSTLRQSTAYGDFLGGGGFLDEGGGTPDKARLVLTLDPTSGDVYLAGPTGTTGSPAYNPALIGTAGGAVPTFSGLAAGFIAHFSADLKSLVQATYVSGSSASLSGIANSAAASVSSIAVDPVSGDILIVGTSNSATLPTTAGVFQSTRDPAVKFTGYVARLPNTLASFSRFSYFSAGTSNVSTDTYLQSIVVHPSNGDIYIAGETNGNLLIGASGGYQSSIPAVSPLIPASNAQAEFIARVAPDLSLIRQSTYLYDGQLGYGDYYHPGTNTRNYGLAVLAGGDVVSLGLACPGTAGGIQSQNNGGVDICVARLAADLRTLTQATFLGGSGPEYNGTLAIAGGTAAIYVAGGTGSQDFPGTTGGAQTTFATGGTVNGFIAELSSDLSGAASSGVLEFSAATYSAADTAGSAAITVVRQGGSSGAVSVTFATSDGTGRANIDYTPTLQTVNFADGDTSPKTIQIPIMVDTQVAGNETVNLTLSRVTGNAALGSPATAVLTITQTAAPSAGTLEFSAAAYSAHDTDGHATITLTRTGGDSGAVTVNFATSDGTATAGTDYSTTSQVVSFGAGDSASKSVTVPIAVNAKIAGNETVNLTLSAVSGGATLGSPAHAVLDIIQTTAPVVPPSPHSVKVDGSGGGAISLPGLALLVILVGLLRSRRAGVPGVIAVAAVALTATIASGPSRAGTLDYYAGVSLGRTQTSATAADLSNGLAAIGFPDARVTVDHHKLGGEVFIGTQLDRYFSVELAYVDLNRVRTHSIFLSTDVAAAARAVAELHPYSVRGGALTGLASIPLGPSVTMFARAGALVWRGEIVADAAGSELVSARETRVSGVVGGGGAINVTTRVALRVEWQRFFLSRYSMDLATLGIQVSF